MEDQNSARSMSTYAGQNEEEIWKIIMKQADTDHDGRISKNEFRSTMAKVIEQRNSVFQR
jgi:Ca2+-binding EF-hand superfamily protein